MFRIFSTKFLYLPCRTTWRRAFLFSGLLMLIIVDELMQLLGLSGHFGLGNTNNFAIIDVAGAFIVGLTKA